MVPANQPRLIFLPTHMVRNLIEEEMRMRKGNTNREVPLDAVPERRTE